MRVVFALVSCVPFAMSGCAPLGSPYVDSYNSKVISNTQPFVTEINNSTATALTAAPVEDSASMTGTFLLSVTDIGDTGIIAGQINMNANFAAGTVSGTMSKFVEVQSGTGSSLVGTDMYGDVDYSGTIAVSTGASDDISASGAGRVRSTNGTQYGVTTSMNGDFYRRPGSELGAVGAITMSAEAAAATGSGSGIYIVTE